MDANAVKLGERQQLFRARFAIPAFDGHERGTGELDGFRCLLLREPRCGAGYAESFADPSLFGGSHGAP